MPFTFADFMQECFSMPVGKSENFYVLPSSPAERAEFHRQATNRGMKFDLKFFGGHGTGISATRIH